MRCVLKGAAVFAAVFLASAVPASAQDGGFAVEARGTYGFPVGDFSDDLGAESDFGFGASAILSLTPGVGVYGGWARDRFDCELCGSGDDIRVEGIEGGLIFFFDRAGFVPWLKAGLLGHRTRVSIQGVESESDRSLGFQGALGADIPLGPTFSLVPAVRYNHIPSEFELLNLEIVDADVEVDTQYFSVDLGLRIHTRR